MSPVEKTVKKWSLIRMSLKSEKFPGMADYLLTDNPAVSRMHAIIHKIDGAYYICDNYSTNATFLNGEQLEAGKKIISCLTVCVSALPMMNLPII